MIVKFRTSSWDLKIERVECEKETEKCLWISYRGNAPSRTDKQSNYAMYHDSWILAHEYLLKRESGSVESARLNLEAAKRSLGIVEGMKNPYDELESTL